MVAQSQVAAWEAWALSQMRVMVDRSVLAVLHLTGRFGVCLVVIAQVATVLWVVRAVHITPHPVARRSADNTSGRS